jgi:pullulanase-type alpha-1,6-glucosidase
VFNSYRDAGYAVMKIPDGSGVDVGWMLKCQLAVTAHDEAGRLRDATSVQSHGALDDAYGGYTGELGCVVHSDNSGADVALWAPNARRVTLLLHGGPRGGDAHRMEMSESADDGVWRASCGGEWVGKYYQYEIETYHPWGGGAPDGGLGGVVTSYVTDPYSRSLSADGERTHICDVNAPELNPTGWDSLKKPKPPGGGEVFEPTDMAIYELHVRDFSALDESTPDALRGKYAAFTCDGSVPVRHLENLAKAGLTHVHLLPSYDFGSVPERAENQAGIDHGWLASLPSNSDEQQAAVGAIANDDAFNWGYDPVHYGVPEGSYATDPDGSARVVEFRSMVQGLNKIGLRTVCDVVYNHTLSAGPSDGKSVLDKCVPGYYHRRNMDGFYENSTCCNNTASENSMMERLIVDDLVHWARDYKVDGFRFDLMGHIMLRTIIKARDALASLTMEKDGVDGRSIYLYGEGWDYAEVERNRVGVNASQLNLAGTGVGSFNDRLREGIMGGSPFGDPRTQGVLTGLFFAPNGFIEQGTADNQRDRVMEDCEKVIAAMAGNLKEYRFTNRKGFSTPGKDAAWVGSNVGYAAEPRETVNYVSGEFTFTFIRMGNSID